MLFILICVACVVSVRADVSDDVIIDGVRHRTEKIYENLPMPHFLRVDDTSNKLYFRDNSDQWLVGTINLNTKELKYIEGVRQANQATIDQETQTVYIGTYTGLFKYNFSTDKVERIEVLTDVNVWIAYFRGALYYTNGKASTVYTLIDGQSTKYIELDDKVERLLIDKDDNIYLSNGGVVYRQKEGARAVILYNGDFVKDFLTDTNDSVYFITGNALYQICSGSDTVRKVISIDDLRGLTFDNKNNIIYSNAKNIYILKPIDKIKNKLDYIDKKIDTKIDYSERIIKQKIDDLETKIDTKMENLVQIIDTKLVNLEKRITSILQQVLNNTISSTYSPRTDATSEMYPTSA